MNWLERRWYASKPAPCWLTPLESLFKSLAHRKKNKAIAQSWTAPVPVIVVGNISVGGTGKTPLVSYLVELLRSEGFSPGVISRGYRSAAPQYPFDVSLAENVSQCGDEPYLIHQRNNCPVVIDADRVSAAKYLLEKYDCDVIISDDGLQHYRLGRDIEIAVVDGKRGLGNGHCLPAGPLREPPQRLASVDFIISNGALCREIPELDTSQYMMQLEPQTFVSIDRSTEAPLSIFDGKPVNAVAGIGNPQRFFDTLDGCSQATIIEHRFPDHHHYSESDLNFADNKPVVMTEKDAVKMAEIALPDAWYLNVSARLPDAFAEQVLERFKAVMINKDLITKGMKKNG